MSGIMQATLFRSAAPVPVTPQAWFGGGSTPGSPVGLSRVDRITFATDTATASVRGPLSLARFGLAAASNAN